MKRKDGGIIRISEDTKEKLNQYCIERFRCELRYISKDFLLQNLFKDYEKLKITNK